MVDHSKTKLQNVPFSNVFGIWMFSVRAPTLACFTNTVRLLIRGIWIADCFVQFSGSHNCSSLHHAFNNGLLYDLNAAPIRLSHHLCILNTVTIWILDTRIPDLSEYWVYSIQMVVMWLAGSFKYRTFWTINRLFQSGFQPTIRIQDHLTTRHKSTIQIED